MKRRFRKKIFWKCVKKLIKVKIYRVKYWGKLIIISRRIKLIRLEIVVMCLVSVYRIGLLFVLTISHFRWPTMTLSYQNLMNLVFSTSSMMSYRPSSMRRRLLSLNYLWKDLSMMTRCFNVRLLKLSER